MSSIVAVLVVPTEGDPGGLLTHGRLLEGSSIGQWTFNGRPPWVETEDREHALPLVWDGALVPDGLDRALRCGGTDDCDTFDRHPSLDRVLELASWLVARGLASRVVRLARLDGRLMEVP